jgi:hypothetical protein
MFPDLLTEGIKWPYHEMDVANLHVSQFLDFEGQAFVLVVTQVVKEECLEKLNVAEFPLSKAVCHLPFDLPFQYVLMIILAGLRILDDL